MNNKVKKLAKQYKRKLLSELKRVSLGKQAKNLENTMWIGDIADHIAICNAILLNKRNASRMLENLDTDSREEFPDPLYSLVCYGDEDEEYE